MSEKKGNKVNKQPQRRMLIPREFLYSTDLLKWATFLCVCLSTISAVIQREVLGMDALSSAALHEMAQTNRLAERWANVALICTYLSVMAIPVFAKLTYEGWVHSKSRKKYLLRLLGIALISEFPYDWAMSGTWVNMASQNPIWSMAVIVVMLTMFRQFEKPGSNGALLIKLLATLAASGWVLVMRSFMGDLMVLIAACYYLFSDKKWMGTISAAAISIIQFPASAGAFFTYWYDGTKGKTPRWVFYALYPAQLLVIGAIGRML